MIIHAIHFYQSKSKVLLVPLSHVKNYMCSVFYTVLFSNLLKAFISIGNNSLFITSDV